LQCRNDLARVRVPQQEVPLEPAACDVLERLAPAEAAHSCSRTQRYLFIAAPDAIYSRARNYYYNHSSAGGRGLGKG
jgi:hypothetical protein